MTKIIASEVATIKLGTMQIEGLLFADGKFGVAVTQIISLFQLSQDNPTRDVKTLLGAGSSLVKTKTNREQVEGVRVRRDENAVIIEQFETVLLELTIKGNKTAISLSRALTGLILHQLFCDGFKIKFDADNRQQWLTDRIESKEEFSILTTAIKETREAAGKEINRFHYSTPADAINRGLFGKTSKQIREELNIPKEDLIRDHFGRRALRWITNVEEASARRVRAGQKPCEAIASVITELGYEVIDYRN